MFLEFAIIGTTASGKSDLAIEVAERFKGVILSIDSLGIYKEIDIASAKPSREELARIRHFGVDLVFADEYFSVGEFIKEYEKAKSYARNLDIPLIITGGSSFYLKAMLSGLAPKIDDVELDIKEADLACLIESIDSEFAQKFSLNDKFRVGKWYSIYKTTGEIPSKFLRENTKSPAIENLQIFEILTDREILRARVEKRTRKMIENGLIDEAKFLFGKYDENLKPLNSIGLRECREFLSGKIDEKELESLITTHTMQLAKRQRTFNKSQFENKISLNLEDLKLQILRFKNHS